MTVLDHRALFHTGVVVRDFDRALDAASELLGVTWGPRGDAQTPIVLSDGTSRVVSFRYAYSAEGPVRLEFVAAVDGTPWEPVGAGQVHHLGYWSTDVPVDSARLSGADVPLVANVGTDDPDAPPRIAYHQTHGYFIELVPVSLRAALFGED